MIDDLFATKCNVVVSSLTEGLGDVTLERGDANQALTENDLFENILKSIESCNNEVISMPLWETDGHYSTVYLVALTLGLSDDLAKKLATYAEQPDTYVHSEYDFELNQTWFYPKEQWNTHALTNGFHGIEEMASALKFLYMYGEKFLILPYTIEHALSPDGPQPDYIWIRPRWYYLYVNNLAKLLSIKYNVKKQFDASKFETMLGFAKENSCKLKGIIDFEIARKLGRNYFVMPVFYADKLLVANIDQVFVTNYLEETRKAKDNALKYISQNYSGLRVKVTEIKAGMNFNSECFYNTVAYKIAF